MNSINKLVKNRILQSNAPGKIWSYNDFIDLPHLAVSKALSNLYKSKILSRQRKGLYYIPRKSIVGDVAPNIERVAIATALTKSTYAYISGLYGFNRIGLTTQVPNVITIACDNPLRNTDRIQFIKRKRPVSGTEIERIVLDAIKNIQTIPDTTPNESIIKIKNIIEAGRISINDLVRSAFTEPPVVKAVVGALGQEFNADKQLLKQLKTEVNPNTVFYLDIVESLLYAKEWRIKPRQKNNYHNSL